LCCFCGWMSETLLRKRHTLRMNESIVEQVG
jgi:hypothetical protein